jgi:hypothetical protein
MGAFASRGGLQLVQFIAASAACQRLVWLSISRKFAYHNGVYDFAGQALFARND